MVFGSELTVVGIYPTVHKAQGERGKGGGRTRKKPYVVHWELQEPVHSGAHCFASLHLAKVPSPSGPGRPQPPKLWTKHGCQPSFRRGRIGGGSRVSVNWAREHGVSEVFVVEGQVEVLLLPRA